MDPVLRRGMAERTPKINPTVAEGLAVKEMKFVEQYVDEIVRYAEQDFPEGLKYIDYRRLTPIEEYLRVTEIRNSKSQYDIARCDVYMIVLNFEFKGEKIQKPLYLPFVRPGGILILRGSTFSIAPVLADKGISLGTDSAFVQIPKAKITFRRTRHHFIAAGIRRTPNVVHSWLHNRNRKNASQHVKPTVKIETCLMHYLFCKYGVHETFRRFYKTRIQIGYPDEINPDNYPEDKWIICRSIQHKPRRLKVRQYIPTEIRIAIREPDFDIVTEAMIAGFFYVADHFPTRIKPEYLDGSRHEIWLWRVLLGLIIGTTSGGEGNIKEAMDEHMESLDSYIDAGAKASLAQGDIHVEDIYELIYHVIEVLSQMTVQSSDAITTMYDKQLMVLRYVLRDINNGIFQMLFKLKNTVKKKKELTYNDVVKIIRKMPRTDEVLKMNNGSKHGEVNSVSLPGDNMFFKITSQLVLQTDSGGGMSKSKANKAGPSRFLHSSIAEVASYGVLPSSEPTGRSRINPFVTIDDDGSIIRDPDRIDLINKTQEAIKRDE